MTDYCEQKKKRGYSRKKTQLGVTGFLDFIYVTQYLNKSVGRSENLGSGIGNKYKTIFKIDVSKCKSTKLENNA